MNTDVENEDFKSSRIWRHVHWKLPTLRSSMLPTSSGSMRSKDGAHKAWRRRQQTLWNLDNYL